MCVCLCVCMNHKCCADGFLSFPSLVATSVSQHSLDRNSPFYFERESVCVCVCNREREWEIDYSPFYL
jgi:hypothetical protein